MLNFYTSANINRRRAGDDWVMETQVSIDKYQLLDELKELAEEFLKKISLEKNQLKPYWVPQIICREVLKSFY